MNGLVQAAVAFAATMLFILMLRPVAIRMSLTDKPADRKLHKGEVPLIGGIAIYLALIAAAVTDSFISGWSGFGSLQLQSFFAGGGLLLAVGVLDDWRGLSPAIRFVAQIGAGLIMIYGGGIVLYDLGYLLPTGELLMLGSLAVPFTVFATVGVINAINMCDGLDGLSGNMTLVSLAGLGIANSIWGGLTHLQLLNVLSAAIAGFLVFNQRIWTQRAMVFLGDCRQHAAGLCAGLVCY